MTHPNKPELRMSDAASLRITTRGKSARQAAAQAKRRATKQAQRKPS